MKISVIIPAFNSESFINKAVESALSQKEVGEVLVINDGSTDNTILEVQKIKDSRVKIYHHENKVNKGRSATRNLGIIRSSFNLLAFLDADDYFLPYRFENDLKLLETYPRSEGIYNAVGFDFINSNELNEDLYTVTKEVKPEELFLGLLDGKFGHFQIDGLTVKKAAFEKVGLFNTDLEVAEDTDIFWKLSLLCNLYTGIINHPVAMRVVHNNNVFYRKDVYEKFRYNMYESVLKWSCEHKIELDVIDRILRRIWILKHTDEVSLFEEIKYWWFLCFLHKRIFFSVLSIKYFPIIRRRKKVFSFLY
ncbi:glycosyltransferase family 2 protein [Nonlabens sp. Ci31]|uniref:glycosyltransferase family 2 protein n=1 Tax=Nonlabens sp. Ci31 TaxID=2608253 RepID=UPI0014634859|nr:glycosyltransferase family 2 protein [Nonlabens sp. Ci31]QJP32995.1 glycosyltransferase family 2 protein [Nonlabens sp. Ci31]